MPKKAGGSIKSRGESLTASQQDSKLTDYFQVVKGERQAGKHSKAHLSVGKELVQNDIVDGLLKEPAHTSSSIEKVASRRCTRLTRSKPENVATTVAKPSDSVSVGAKAQTVVADAEATKTYVVPPSSPFKRVRVREALVPSVTPKPVEAPELHAPQKGSEEVVTQSAFAQPEAVAQPAEIANRGTDSTEPQKEDAGKADSAASVDKSAAKEEVAKIAQAAAVAPSKSKPKVAPRRISKEAVDVAELKKKLAAFEDCFKAHAANALREPRPRVEENLASNAAEADKSKAAPEGTAVSSIPETSMPAFQRFARLAEAEGETQVAVKDDEAQELTSRDSLPQLPLPPAFKLLAEAFSGCDTVCMLLHNRDELCTFEKLKSSVQRMTRRTFDRPELRRIRRVMPEAYRFYVAGPQRNGVSSLSETAGVRWRQLIIEPNLEADGAAESRPASSNTKDAGTAPIVLESPTKGAHLQLGSVTVECKSPIQRVLLASPKFQQAVASVSSPPKPAASPRKQQPPTPNAKARPHFSLSKQRDRKRIFEAKLLELLHSLHRRFLAELPRPVDLAERGDASIKRWHPMFELRFGSLDVEPMSLPDDDQLQDESAHVAVSARRLFETYERRSNAAYADALQQVRAAPVDGESKAAPTSASSASTSAAAPVKGIPKDLLERIREKERARKLAEAQSNRQAQSWLVSDAAGAVDARTSQYAANTLISGHLDEVVRFIWTMFTTAQKTSLEYKTVANTLRFSRDFENDRASCVSVGQVEQAIDFVCEHSIGWLQKVTITSGATYLKLTDRSKSVAQVLQSIQSHLKPSASSAESK